MSVLNYNYLFQPLNIGSLQVKNRFVLPAVSTNFAHEDGQVSQRMIDYYSARARGGFGMIVVEASAVHPSGKALENEVGVWDDCFIPGLSKLASAIRQNGARAILQLHHAGRQTTSEINGGYPVVAPSAVPCPVRQQMPIALTTEEAGELARSYGLAARRAQLAGFDGVEINASHGYIIAQFMSLYANKRTDRYGGSFENRMRFPTEIIQSIRQQTGASFPVIFRMSGDEAVTAGRGKWETPAVAAKMQEAGADAISVSGGVYASVEHMSGPGRMPPAHNVEAAALVKGSVTVPVITAGRINSPSLAESILAAGKADFVAFGRSGLADPELPNKALTGREEEILPCVGCLQGCIGYLLEEHRTVSCLVNPFAGEEGTMYIHPAVCKKQVCIAGGGPAGLYAAWILAKRGHQVTLFEKDAQLGGQLRLGAVPNGKSELLCGLRHFALQCEKYGVDIRLGTPFTQEALQKERPDVVILATGGQALRPKIPGLDLPFVVEANKVLAGEAFPSGKVLVLGGGMVGCETAEYLADYGVQVTIMEMRSQVAADSPALSRAMLLADLKKKSVDILTDAKACEIYPGGIRYEKAIHQRGAQGVAQRTLEELDAVVLALGCTPYNPLEEMCIGKTSELYVIGDARKPGKAIDHIYQAAKLALTI